MLHFPFFEDMAHRTVTTLHGRLDLKDLPEVYRRWPKFPLVSISDAQRTSPAVRQLGGHRLPRYAGRRLEPVHPRPERLSRFSRPHVAREGARPGAIDIAKRLGMPLKIAAKVDPADRAYFERADRTAA